MIKTLLPVLLFFALFTSCQQPGKYACEASAVEVMHFYNTQITELSIDTLTTGINESYSVFNRSAFGGKQFVSFYQRGGRNYLEYKSSPKNTDEPPNFVKTITDDDWVELQDLIEEFDFWEEPICKRREALDGYTYAMHGLKETSFGFTTQEERHVVRENLIFDKIDALCGYLFDYAEHLNQD